MSTVSPQLTAPRVVLGPRRGGRDYDLLAQSPGLELASSVSERLKQFALESLPFVQPTEALHAFFPLGSSPDAPWFLSIATHHGEVDGNPVKVTSGIVLTIPQLSSVNGWVASFFMPWERPAPPQLGEVLPPAELRWSPPPPTQRNQEVLALADTLAESAVTWRVSESYSAAELMFAVLAATPGARRLNISFLTAPPAIGGMPRPTLAVFSEQAWQATPVRVRETLSFTDLSSENGSPARAAWTSLMDALWSDLPQVARRLEPYGRSFRASALKAAEIVAQRLDAFLETEFQVEGDRIAPLLKTLAASRTIPDRQQRSAVADGLVLSFQAHVLRSPEPDLWLKAYDKLFRSSPVGFPSMYARLAVDTGAVFQWPEDRIKAAAPALIPGFAKALVSELEDGQLLTVPAAVALLNATVDQLEQEPSSETVWRLGAMLIGKLETAAPNTIGPPMQRWLAVATGAARASAMSAAMSPALRRSAREAFTALSGNIRARAFRHASSDDWNIDSLEYALALWKLSSGEA